ncbi:MAG TPA: FAD-binding protein [Candidatus Saccharimonadales bacterium]|nr:FAD-binding protein [Candidatus Saccharimonadales bacterium]
MEPSRNVTLANLTSLAAGGRAEKLYTCTTNDQLHAVLAAAQPDELWVLGYGANVLVADAGLPGKTVLVRTTAITHEDNLVIADAGVWWDDLVQFAINKQLWGLELMSGIPGGVGAAVVGNIAAYGQAVAHSLQWVEIFDTAAQRTRRMTAEELGLNYRFSFFQTPDFKYLVILRAAFQLASGPTTELEYEAALAIARRLGSDLSTLAGRREVIVETRRLGGSLWDYRTPGNYLHTAGSFFRNPLVDLETAEKLMAYDETKRSLELLKKMNQVHGGEQKRVSAAHVLLAAGFKRGQTWGPVRLHPDHILKLENTGDATAQQIYDVAMEIVRTVKEKLAVDIVPEVRFMGQFKH